MIINIYNNNDDDVKNERNMKLNHSIIIKIYFEYAILVFK